MARLQDVIPAIRSVGIVRFIVTLCQEISSDRLTTQAAAMAYAWLFAIFPFLIFLLTLFAYIPEAKKVRAEDVIASSVHRVMANDAAETILTNLHEVLNKPRSGLLSIGLIVTLWIASGGMSMTMSALDAAYDGKRITPFYVQRPVAILLTIVVMVLILTVFLLLPVGTATEQWLAAHNAMPMYMFWAFDLIRYGLAILLLLTILSVLYNFGTRVPHKFTFCSPGALFTLLVWFLLGAAFNFYVNKFGSYQKTYGAVGGVTIILLFFYLDALVLLIGAELNSQIDRWFAERK